MEVGEALRRRRTVRAFLPRAVGRDTLSAILEAALQTPSWADTQPWEIYVAGGEVLERIRAGSIERTRSGVTGGPEMEPPATWPEKCRERTRELTASRAKESGVAVDNAAFQRDFLERNRRFFDAPCVVYLCLERGLSAWSIFDLGLMAQSIMLAAQGQGVESAIAINLVWYPDLIRTEVSIPDDQLIVIGIALGYADEDSPENGFRSPRRSFDDVVKLAGV